MKAEPGTPGVGSEDRESEGQSPESNQLSWEGSQTHSQGLGWGSPTGLAPAPCGQSYLRMFPMALRPRGLGGGILNNFLGNSDNPIIAEHFMGEATTFSQPNLLLFY